MEPVPQRIRPRRAAMIEITDQIAIDPREIQEVFLRASGPGGQNVNKVSTAVQLRFDLRGSPSLPEDLRARAEHLAGRRLTKDGVIVITAARYRSQEQNRDDALARLTGLLKEAARPPPARKPTRPTPGSRTRRLEAKTRRGALKKLRSGKPAEE
jgi:ribosome-associated protein